jgi:hypothetical protein
LHCARFLAFVRPMEGRVEASLGASGTFRRSLVLS